MYATKIFATVQFQSVCCDAVLEFLCSAVNCSCTLLQLEENLTVSTCAAQTWAVNCDIVLQAAADTKSDIRIVP